MGRSRKRSKKFRTKVQVRTKKKPFSRSTTPAELHAKRRGLEEKLGTEPVWDVKQRLENNYAGNNFVADPNIGFGRNCTAGLETRAADGAAAPDCESDDDLRQYEGKPRRDGRKAAAQKPTAQQRRTIEGLLEAHGNDVEAMVRDVKRNPMLLPASKLRKLIEGNTVYGNSGRCGFRVPVKGL